MEELFKKSMELYEKKGIKDINDFLYKKEYEIKSTSYMVNVHHCLQEMKDMVEKGLFEKEHWSYIRVSVAKNDDGDNCIDFGIQHQDKTQKIRKYDQDGNYRKTYAKVRDVFQMLVFEDLSISDDLYEKKHQVFELSNSGIEQLKKSLLNKELLAIYEVYFMEKNLPKKEDNLGKVKI